MLFLAVSSPSCIVKPPSATGDQSVTFTCSVTVCGNAAINTTVKIASNGDDQAVGTNEVTWNTKAKDVKDASVTCSVDFGDAVQCPTPGIDPPSKSGEILLQIFKYLSRITGIVPNTQYSLSSFRPKLVFIILCHVHCAKCT